VRCLLRSANAHRRAESSPAAVGAHVVAALTPRLAARPATTRDAGWLPRAPRASACRRCCRHARPARVRASSAAAVEQTASAALHAPDGASVAPSCAALPHIPALSRRAPAGSVR
jgi:hypothetical protein